MLPRLFEQVVPASRKTQDSIGRLVEFARDEIPASVWLEEFGDRAPWHLVQRNEQHYHLHLHQYRELSHHVYNVVAWENEGPVLYWPTSWGMPFLVALISVLVGVLIAR